MKRSLKNRVKKGIAKMKNYQIGLILATIHSVLSYFYSASFFNFDVDDILAKRNKLLIEVLFFVIMTLVYWGLAWIIRNRKKYKSYIRVALIYFAILMVLLLLVWPGVWRNDDMETAMVARKYVLDGWQHTLTSVFYLLSFKLLPFYSGVVIVQGVIIAVISAYIYNRLLINLGTKKKCLKLILFIPFILPPVLDNSLYPLRPILYSYACVLLVFMMVRCIREKKISTASLVCLAGLFALCMSWRSEGIYLAAVALIYLVVLFRRKLITPFVLFVMLLGSIGGALLIRKFENAQLNQRDQARYTLSSTVEIAAPLVRKAYEEGKTEELEKIDKVLNVDMIVETGWSGESIFWEDNGVREFSANELSEYMKTLMKLVLMYPGEVINERFTEFAKTSALVDDASDVIWDTTSIYDDSPKIRIQRFVTSSDGIMNPINTRLRKLVIRLLEGRDIHDYNNTIFTYSIFWNLLVPLIGIVVFVIWQFVKRRIAVGLIVATILTKTGIVFLTAPGIYHMYYFAEYLLGYVLIAYMVVSLIQHGLAKDKIKISNKEKKK